LRTPASSGEDVDWQARAQALELRVRELERGQAPGTAAPEAQVALVRLDAALQAAYDAGAERAELNALWRRRSELLAALMHAHQDNVHITRI
jgi:hypothetical protein